MFARRWTIKVIKGASDAVPLGPPKPAPRTRKPNVPPQSTRSSGNEKRSSSASAISTSQDNNNARRDSWPDDDDDLNFDDESLSMFASNKQRNKSDDIDPLDAVMRQQLELAALQKAELECEKRILQEKAQLKEAEKQKIQSLLHNERQELEQIQQTSALSGEQAKAAKRTGRWAATPEIRLERWSSSSDDESVGKVARDSKRLTARERRSRANSADTEFYSLSESEDKQDKEPGIETPTLWQPRLSDGSGRSDPDADFAAMCEALALRKQRKQAASSALPSDLSQVPLELLQSLPWPPGETSDYDDLSPSSRKRMWRRSNSEPGSTVEEELSTSPPAARSADNLEGLEHKKPTDPATSTLFSLNDNSFSSNS